MWLATATPGQARRRPLPWIGTSRFSCNGRRCGADGVGVTGFVHLVATTRGWDRSLLRPQRAVWLWERLRRGLPDALSCVLMPDHVHIVAPDGRRATLRRILAAFTVRFGVRFDVLDPERANSVAIAGRMIRYGLFNPLRAALVDDPFIWPWSTLRDLVGAATPSWTALPRIAASLRLSPEAALRGLTTLGGESYAIPRPGPLRCASIDEVRRAVQAAARIAEPAPITTLERRLTVQTCFRIGSPRVADLAAHLDCSIRSVHRDRTTPAPALDSVLLCLSDPRLRVGPLDLPNLALDRPARGGRTS